MVKYNYDLDLVFHALSDPTRRSVLEQVANCEKRITELIPPIDMSLAAISKHVKVLEQAGLIQRRKQGRESFVTLNLSAMASAEQWISMYTALWNGQLDALDIHLKSKKDINKN